MDNIGNRSGNGKIVKQANPKILLIFWKGCSCISKKMQFEKSKCSAEENDLE